MFLNVFVNSNQKNWFTEQSWQVFVLYIQRIGEMLKVNVFVVLNVVGNDNQKNWFIELICKFQYFEFQGLGNIFENQLRRVPKCVWKQ